MTSRDRRVAWFKRHSRSPTIRSFGHAKAAFFGYRVTDTLGTVRRFFGCARYFRSFVCFTEARLTASAVSSAPVVSVVSLVSMMEGLQRKAARRLRPSTSALLRYVRIVLVHCLCSVDVQLGIYALQLTL